MSNRNLAVTTAQPVGIRPHSSESAVKNVIEFLRTELRRFSAWRRQRRDRQKLYDYLASDHRAAADIGYPHRLP